MAAKTKTHKQAELVEPAAAPIVGPETVEQRTLRITKAMYSKEPTREQREEYRALLREKPEIANILGTLPELAQKESLKRFASFPALEDSVRFQLQRLRDDLAGEHPTQLEKLLIEAIVLCYQDYFNFAMLMNTNIGKEITLTALEQWERVLEGKEQRYLRSIAELARVRRLLNLPAPQVNIALAGGQQVNISGNLKAGGNNG